MKTWLLAILPLCIVSCSSVTAAVTHELDSISDDQLASYLEKAGSSATRVSVKFAINTYPDRTVQIQKDGAVIVRAIREVIVPALTNAPLGTVAKGAIDLAVAQLSKQLTGSPLATIASVADTVVELVPLPANPTDKLSARLQKGIASSFLGIAEGLEKALNIPPPAPGTSGTPGPGAPPPPPAPK